MRKIVIGLVAAASLSACATETVPMCRAPAAHELAAFSAIVSHDAQGLSAAMTPGPLRDAVARRDPLVSSYLWGSQGVTQGTALGMLTRPPLCVLDDPALPASDAVRQILVYPQAAADRVWPALETPLADAPPPYGHARRDYMTCRFEQTAAGWKLADLCGYAPATSPPPAVAR